MRDNILLVNHSLYPVSNALLLGNNLVPSKIISLSTRGQAGDSTTPASRPRTTRPRAQSESRLAITFNLSFAQLKR